MSEHIHEVQIYYEDTDLSGVVYHANYLRYMERAREHIIGPDRLHELYYTHDVGFVVYKCEMTFREGARLGDIIQVRTRVEMQSPYRAIFHQDIWKRDGAQPMVEGQVQLVTVNQKQELVKLPLDVIEEISGYTGPDNK